MSFLRKRLFLLFLLLLLQTNTPLLAQIQYEEDSQHLRQYPQSHQLYPRDNHNQAQVTIRGTIGSQFSTTDEIELLVTKHFLDNSKEYFLFTQNSSDSFSFAPQIEAGMYLYDFDLSLRRNGLLLHSENIAKDVVCGDVYIIAGQSNALGLIANSPIEGQIQDSLYQEYPNQGSNKIFSKSLGQIPPYNGLNGATTNYNPEDKNWGPARSSNHINGGLVGTWGLKLQYLIQQEHQMPTCIINGAYGGTRLDEHQQEQSLQNDSLDLTTLFGALNYRIQQAQVKDHIKGVIWYQGESENTLDLAQSYQKRMNHLISNWEAQWGAIQKIYLIQIHTGCNYHGQGSIVREQQRTFQRPTGKPQNIVSLTANGIGERPSPNNDPYYGCHFSRAAYNNLAHRLFQRISFDFYKGQTPITSPNVTQAYYQGNQLIVAFDQTLADCPDGLEQQFLFYNNNKLVSPVVFEHKDLYTVDNKLYFSVSSHVPQAITYGLNDDPVYHGEMIWLKNQAGYAAFSFDKVPIQQGPCSNDFFTVFSNPILDNAPFRYKLKTCFLDSKLKIYSILGQLIYQKDIPSTFTDESIDFSNFPKGLYIVNIENNRQLLYSQKILKH